MFILGIIQKKITMQVEGKVWGVTKPVIITPSIEVHKIYIKKDGFCSKHCHQSKINAFYVIDGTLLIKRWKNNYDLVDETILKDGETSIVPAGEHHQFKALCSTNALEIYWTELDRNDIIRETIGGTNDINI